MVVIGIDAHKRNHTAVAVDEVGRQLATRTGAATTAAHPGLLGWGKELGGGGGWAGDKGGGGGGGGGGGVWGAGRAGGGGAPAGRGGGAGGGPPKGGGRPPRRRPPLRQVRPVGRLGGGPRRATRTGPAHR